MDAIIHTEDSSKVYPGTDFAMADKLNLDVRAGEIFSSHWAQRRGEDHDRVDGPRKVGADIRQGRCWPGSTSVAHPALAKLR